MDCAELRINKQFFVCSSINPDKYMMLPKACKSVVLDCVINLTLKLILECIISSMILSAPYNA